MEITKIYTTLFKSSLIIGFTRIWEVDYKEFFLFPSIRISHWNTTGNNGLFLYINWLCFCLTLCSDPEEASAQRGEEKKWNNVLDKRSIHALSQFPVSPDPCEDCKVGQECGGCEVHTGQKEIIINKTANVGKSEPSFIDKRKAEVKEKQVKICKQIDNIKYEHTVTHLKDNLYQYRKIDFEINLSPLQSGMVANILQEGSKEIHGDNFHDIMEKVIMDIDEHIYMTVEEK